jgi:hypothetical protein
VSALGSGATCGAHAGVVAVDLCPRCGRFLCGECVELVGEQAFCAPCASVVTAQPSRPARWSVGLSLAGLVGMGLGLFTQGRAGLLLWALAIPTGVLGFAMALGALRGEPSSATARRAKWGRAIATLHLMSIFALLVSFGAFLVTRRG